MSILKVARLGHPILRKPTLRLEPSEIANPAIQRLIDDMFDTMHEYQGVGLAAPQVHHSIRLFVAGLDDPDVGLSPVVMVNPDLEPVGEDTEEDWEGCLSIPDIQGRVPRPTQIRVRSLDRKGQEQSMTASGFAARIIQHEADHLEGILFVDRMNSFDSLTFLSEYNRYWDQAETSGST